MLFAAKTHKYGCPLRVTGTKKGTWQHALAGFLQCHLSRLSIIDPYIVSGSQDVVELCRARSSMISYGFSIDVQDCFYSLPHEGFNAVRDCIEENGIVNFQNTCAISIQASLELMVYRDSTVVGLEDRLYLGNREFSSGQVSHQCSVISY